MRFAGLFPGQGSQVVGMGESLSRTSEGREIFDRADNALGFSLSDLCFQGPLEKLTLTEFAQPAILTTSFIAYSIFSKPLAAAAGHSLGEYTALVAAGALSFEDAVVLVHKRGRYMQEAVPAGEGKMVAVLGPSEAEISAVISTVAEGVKEIANLNSPGQTVVAGDLIGVNAFTEAIKKAGGKVIPLNVSAPFHCSLMKPAAESLSKDLDAISFGDLKFPVFANVTGQKVLKGIEARELLKRQVCGAVRWVDCVTNLIKEIQVQKAIEFGPGSVLSKLLKRINPEISSIEVFDCESLEKAALL